MDYVRLRGLRYRSFHGVAAQERQLGQPFIVDVDLGLDAQPAGQSDDLSQTVNYDDAANVIGGIVEGEPKHLIEAVAEEIAVSLLRRFELLQTVRVVVHKPAAPIDAIFDDVAIEITRSR